MKTLPLDEILASKTLEWDVVPEFLQEAQDSIKDKKEKAKKKKKFPPAFIDISIICQDCGCELWGGAYKPGIIPKLQKLIKKSGWIHHPSDGTLCKACAQKHEDELYED